MTKHIYFCGEVVVDLLEENQGSGDFKMLLGGSQFHGARGARKAATREKMDITSGFVGPLSTDMFGQRFAKVMIDEDIDMSGIKRVERNTTLAIVAIQPGKENAFSFYGRDTAEQMTKIDDLPTSLGADTESKICCFGSISTVMEPARFAWLEFARQQRDGGLVFYDLNTRPAIAKNPEDYRKLVLEWAQTAHIMKASDADIEWAYPDTSMEDVAKIWLNAGTNMAVFTKGMHGSEAHTNNMKAEASTLDLVAKNTVGAGDNFNAGLALYLTKHGCADPTSLEAMDQATLVEVLQGANNTAAYHLVSIGAKPREAA